MHVSHQQKLFKAGFTIYKGVKCEKQGPIVKVKTPDYQEWHTSEKGFASVAALKRRLAELDKLPDHVDLYDTKNNVV